MCRLLGLDGEAVEYVVALVACDLDDFAVPFDRQEAVADRLVELAKALHVRLEA